MSAGKAKKRSSVSTHSYDVISWVIANVMDANKHLSSGKDLSTFKCPTSTHATTLLMAVEDPKNLLKFIEHKSKLEAARAKKTRANQLMRDDQRKQFRFLDAVLAEMPVSFKVEKMQAAETCEPKSTQS